MTHQAQQQQPPITVSDGRKPGWYWIDDSINQHYAQEIKAVGVAVYTALVMSARGRTEFTAGLDGLGTLAGLDSREAVIAAIQRLADAGLIAIFRTRGRQNVYRILNVGAPDPNVSRPQRPKDRPQPVGLTDSSAPNQSVKPTTQPVGLTDSFSPNQSVKPTGVVGLTDSFSPNQSVKPTLLRDIDIDTHHHVDPQTTHDDDAKIARPNLRDAIATWDDLREFYGDDEVVMAQRVASNQARKFDLAYIRGVLRRRALQGSPRAQRLAPDPAAPAQVYEPEYVVSPPPPPPPLPPASPEWQKVIEFDRRLSSILDKMRGELIGNELVITGDPQMLRTLAPRYGEIALKFWKHCGNPPSATVRFVLEPAPPGATTSAGNEIT